MRSLNDDLIGLDLRLMAASDPRQVARFAEILATGAVPTLAQRRTEETETEEQEQGSEESREESETTTESETQSERQEESEESQTSSDEPSAPASTAPDRTRKPYGSTLAKRAAPLRVNRNPQEPTWKLG
jgi:hypothetical protein